MKKFNCLYKGLRQLLIFFLVIFFVFPVVSWAFFDRENDYIGIVEDSTLSRKLLFNTLTKMNITSGHIRLYKTAEDAEYEYVNGAKDGGKPCSVFLPDFNLDSAFVSIKGADNFDAKGNIDGDVFIQKIRNHSKLKPIEEQPRFFTVSAESSKNLGTNQISSNDLKLRNMGYPRKTFKMLEDEVGDSYYMMEGPGGKKLDGLVEWLDRVPTSRPDDQGEVDGAFFPTDYSDSTSSSRGSSDSSVVGGHCLDTAYTNAVLPTSAFPGLNDLLSRLPSSRPFHSSNGAGIRGLLSRRKSMGIAGSGSGKIVHNRRDSLGGSNDVVEIFKKRSENLQNNSGRNRSYSVPNLDR